MTPSERREHDPLIGTLFADRYQVQSRLGKGGMAIVYKAMDRNLGRDVALKVLRTDVAPDPSAAKRLVREARAAAQLHHPHIITIHDVGEAGGVVFMVMEVLVGRPLSDMMEAEGAVAVERTLDMGEQIASALSIAHSAGIIHRDIKPENLFLIDHGSKTDFIKMLDFSIAKLPNQMVTAALTRAGSVFGTPHYMAPEQIEHPLEVDHRADGARGALVALAIVLSVMALVALALLGLVTVYWRLSRSTAARAVRAEVEQMIEQKSVPGLPRGRVVFRTGNPSPETDGSYVVADLVPESGSALPIAVRLRPTYDVAAGGSGFGPILERSIDTGDADGQGLVFFDLETGRVSRPPFAVTFRPGHATFVELTPELLAWVRAQDMDLLVHFGDRSWDMLTLETQEDFAGQSGDWASLAAEDAVAIFARKDAAGQLRDLVPASSSGHSYSEGLGSVTACRTRRNTVGVYQVEGIENTTRRGVGLRYKLVQTPALAPASGRN